LFLVGRPAAPVAPPPAAGYRPREVVEADPRLRTALDWIGGGLFSPGAVDTFRDVVDSLLNEDRFLVLRDFASYVETQDRAAAVFTDPDRWTGMAIVNASAMGRFSSDRAVREYASKIWNVTPVRVEMSQSS
jgi:starch phosphorylase